MYIYMFFFFCAINQRIELKCAIELDLQGLQMVCKEMEQKTGSNRLYLFLERRGMGIENFNSFMGIYESLPFGKKKPTIAVPFSLSLV